MNATLLAVSVVDLARLGWPRPRGHSHTLACVLCPDIKKEFDKKYGPTWHCIVGRNFGSYVTHETKHFLYFYLGQVRVEVAWRRCPSCSDASLLHMRLPQVAVLLFKSG